MHSLSVSNVDIKDKSEETNDDSVDTVALDANLSFFKNVGCEGLLLLFTAFTFFLVFGWLFLRYMEQWSFTRLSPFFFPCMAIVYLIRGIYLLRSWKRLAKKYILQKPSSRRNVNRHKNMCSTLLKMRKAIGMRGKYFLWKLYISEIIQSLNQILNFYSLYLCTAPVETTSALGLMVGVGSLHSAYLISKPLTGKIRLRLVRVNCIVDVLCLAVPLLVSHFLYKISIAPSEMVQITLIPAISLAGKLGTLFKEVVGSKAVIETQLRKEKRLTEVSRFNERLRWESRYAKIAHEQEKNMPKSFSTFAVVFNVLVALFFIIFSVIHLLVLPNDCDNELWGNSCHNKVPFCKNFFEPNCNCASLRIINNYNITALPGPVIGSMTALRKFYALNSTLKYLPPNMDQLTSMVDFEIAYTLLQHFDVDVSKWMMLNVLYLYYNDLRRFNPTGLWTHDSISGIAITGTPGVAIFGSAGFKLPKLRYLDLGENQMNLEVEFTRENFPQLNFLFIGGNTVQKFPALQDQLIHLSVPRCNVTSLPAYLSQLKNLKYLDIRDNNISEVRSSLKTLIQLNRIEAYFHGNPVCQTDSSLDCDRLCSNICLSRELVGDGTCDMKCFQKSCKYDGGDCTE